MRDYFLGKVREGRLLAKRAIKAGDERPEPKAKDVLSDSENGELVADLKRVRDAIDIFLVAALPERPPRQEGRPPAERLRTACEQAYKLYLLSGCTAPEAKRQAAILIGRVGLFGEPTARSGKGERTQASLWYDRFRKTLKQ